MAESIPKGQRPVKVGVILGTRPEAIKLAPVILELPKHGLKPVIISTGQHRGMLDQALDIFKITPDIDLKIMTKGQSLFQISTRALAGLEKALAGLDMVLVQGDTTSAFIGALAAFYLKIPVGHVEAGLRTGNIYSPFPEEANRSLITPLAALHFAPTPGARKNLRRCNVPSDRIFVTGNTGIDAARIVSERLPKITPKKNFILVTIHRRENRGKTLEGILGGLKVLLKRRLDIELLLPAHPSPEVRDTIQKVMKDAPRCHITDPLRYDLLIQAMRRSYLILTDSGGIQEEASFFGVPTLILRDKTERPEAVEVGAARIVGTLPVHIVREAVTLLDHPRKYKRMAKAGCPFGNGHAAQTIALIIAEWLKNES